MRPADVAIIGLACRFPSAAHPAELWRVLRDGLEVTRVAGGQTRREGLLDNVAEFDADFFNVSPREAAAMDPRQRLALELAWELLEDAFLVPQTLRGERVTVYLGAMSDDYAVLTLDTAEHVDHHSFAGISRAMIANRISYALGLYGPSMTIDSGQSSSLVAVHAAVQSLRSGESKLAIAGGVHLNLASETGLLEREFGAVSASGHTYAFDARADGYVRSEGGGLVLLKPLHAALEDGDRIRAVISGTAVGNAGHTAAGQTAPSVAGQADVIRRALGDAGLQPGQLQYVEAHGTGTEIGDPVEANALGEAIGTLRHHPLTVGSVKTNIGHAGGAAGIAGLLKTVLAIENGAIPASLNYETPRIELDGLGLRVNTALTAWPAGEEPRRAGVSSFGMGGTNAHVIVEQAPAQPTTLRTERENGPTAWLLSGRSERALANQAARLAAHVTGDARLDANDVGWSLATTRSVFEHRAALVGDDRETLAAALAAVARGEPHPNAIVGRAHAPGKTAFVFPGQGAQSRGMGAQLYARFPVFAEAFDEAAAALDDRLRDVMWGSDPKALDDTEFAQQALFAVQTALVALLRHWGVVPTAVMGHSVGEITAAHVAGVLTLPDAAKVVAARGRLMSGLPAGGAMVAIAAGEAEVGPLLTDGVTIAAVNGPDAVVISGAEAPVAAIAQTLVDRGRRSHRLAVSHAFHSPLMEPMIDAFEAAIADISPKEPRIPLVSNVSGQLAEPGYGSARYWAEHVRRPVRFADGVRAAEASGAGVFVEIGPAGGLSAAAEQSLATEHPVATVTLAKERAEVESLLTAAGRLFTTGVPVDWSAVLRRGRRVELPTYGFVRQRFWLGDGTGAPTPTIPDESAERLRQLPPLERRRQLIELVRAHAAAVLGHSDSHAVDPDRAFQDLGFDSLTGVELRNRLKADTGLALSRTLVFDYPNPAALADHLAQQLLHGGPEQSDDEKVWSALRKIPLHELRRTGLLDKLLALAGDPEKSLADSTVTDDAIDSLSPDALIALALDANKENDAPG